MSDRKNLWGIHNGIYKREKYYLKPSTSQFPSQFPSSPPPTLASLVKWCIVRNPYDRIISAYHFIGNNLPFEKFVYWVYGELDKYYRQKQEPFVVILPQWEFIINEHGKNGMDEILHFETLKRDFKAFQKKYNLQHLTLPHINARKRHSTDLKSYYTKELEEMVYHMYKWDFKMLKYKRIRLL
jgi:hypothetical protein